MLSADTGNQLLDGMIRCWCSRPRSDQIPAQSRTYAVIRYRIDRWYRGFLVDSRGKVEQALQSITEYRYTSPHWRVHTFWTCLTTGVG